MSQQTKKESSKSSGSKLEDDLLWLLMTNGFPLPKPQQSLSPDITPKRKWAVDFVYYLPTGELHIEVQGGTWIRGRHSTGKGARSDSQKLNYSACLGHRTLYVTSDMIRDRTALDWIYLALFHSKTGYGADDPYRLPGDHHRTPLKHFVEERGKHYGEPLSLEAVCRIRRKRRKNRVKRSASRKSTGQKVSKGVRAKTPGKPDRKLRSRLRNKDTGKTKASRKSQGNKRKTTAGGNTNRRV